MADNISAVDGPPRLTNDGPLEISFLGVGNAFAGDIGHTNVLVTKGEDHLLVDMGTSAATSWRALTSQPIADIDNLFVTHAHADHAGGLEYFGSVRRFGKGRPDAPRPKLFIPEEFVEPLWSMSLRGGLGYNEKDAHGDIEIFERYYDIVQLKEERDAGQPTWKGKVGGISIEAFRTRHVLGGADNGSAPTFKSYGLLIDDRVYFSSDSQFDKGLIDRYSDRAEFWIHDGAIEPSPLHASVAELSTLPEAIRSRMLLAHCSERHVDQTPDGFFGLARRMTRYRLDSES